MFVSLTSAHLWMVSGPTPPSTSMSNEGNWLLSQLTWSHRNTKNRLKTGSTPCYNTFSRYYQDRLKQHSSVVLNLHCWPDLKDSLGGACFDEQVLLFKLLSGTNQTNVTTRVKKLKVRETTQHWNFFIDTLMLYNLVSSCGLPKSYMARQLQTGILHHCESET